MKYFIGSGNVYAKVPGEGEWAGKEYLMACPLRADGTFWGITKSLDGTTDWVETNCEWYEVSKEYLAENPEFEKELITAYIILGVPK